MLLILSIIPFFLVFIVSIIKIKEIYYKINLPIISDKEKRRLLNKRRHQRNVNLRKRQNKKKCK